MRWCPRFLRRPPYTVFDQPERQRVHDELAKEETAREFHATFTTSDPAATAIDTSDFAPAPKLKAGDIVTRRFSDEPMIVVRSKIVPDYEAGDGDRSQVAYDLEHPGFAQDYELETLLDHMKDADSILTPATRAQIASRRAAKFWEARAEVVEDLRIEEARSHNRELNALKGRTTALVNFLRGLSSFPEGADALHEVEQICFPQAKMGDGEGNS